METRSSHMLVGAVALALFAALFLFILWIARFDTSDSQPYDIFFESVAGLAPGSSVNFSGVPVGTVKSIHLLPDSPEFIRVRIAVDEETPVLQGTRATISSVGFTGVSIVSLEGAIKGAAPITEEGPFGVPVIPTKPGTLDSLLNAAPQLVERVSELTARLNEVLDEQNQEAITGILENSERITGAFAARSDEIAATVAEARATLRELAIAANEIGRAANATTELLNEEGEPLAAQLRETLARAESTLAELEATAEAAGNTVETVNAQTLPEVNLLIRDLRQVSTSLGAIAAKLDEDPAGALIGGRTLPTYDPEEAN